MDLKEELQSRRAFFDTKLMDYLQKDYPRKLYDAARHLPQAGGKRLRPILAMLACEALEGKPERVVPFSVALELTHNFTLVHDDVMDKARLRRNTPTVHVEYGEPLALLAGDLLFAKSFEVIYDVSDAEIVHELCLKLSRHTQEICEGQQLDMEFEQRNHVSEDEYLDMIEKKTARLFDLAAYGGALIGGRSKQKAEALATYGRYLGLAFQIWDDYLDLSANEENLGKDIGNDIRNGKKTLIVIHAFENASRQDHKKLIEILGDKNATTTDIQTVVRLFKKIGSLSYAQQVAHRFCEQAKEQLHVLSDSDPKNILLALADYSTSRKK